MTRLIHAIQVDVLVQVRNNLYAIGIGVGVLVAAILSQLLNVNQVATVVPVIVLLVAGGSTLLYVAGMILFEKDEGTLNAVIVSPLRPSEYLWSKIITLTALGTLESLIMAGGAVFIMSFGNDIAVPNIPILLLGTVALGVLYTLVGIIMIARYDKITDFLVPAVVVASVLQLPFVYFMDLIVHPAFLIIPSSAPTMLMHGAFTSLELWQWVYGIGYTGVILVSLTIWAYRAFNTHIVAKVG